MSDESSVHGGRSPEERLEILEKEGIIAVHDDETVTLTVDFESTRGIYHDSYADVEKAEYHQAVSDVFGIDVETVPERLEELDVTREQFIALLAVNSHVDGEYSLPERARMAMVVTDLAPPSPVPESIEEINDDSYEAFLEEHDRAAVTVWKRFCTPCQRMKDELDETRATLPDAVAGIDGETAPEFCRSFDVEAAPSVLLFEDGELVESLRGYQGPEAIEDACTAVYGNA